jgi:UDP-GlcNAc:undecaprenyl-phosphate/decaprenyl-phosphate GlcNAc-1-phosphate transferase
VIADTTPWLPAFPPFLVASMVCIAAIPLTVILAHRVGAVAHPDDDRHLHAQSTPRLGGIAIFIGFAAALLVFGANVPERWEILAVCAAITIAMAVDDILDLAWFVKLVVEVGVGIAVAAAGITISFFAVPGTHGTDLVQLGWLAVPITVAWVVGMQNSINFLDGSDGVAAGVVAIVAAVCLLAAVNKVENPSDVQSGVVVMSGALMGCCAGFLVFNLPPARIFMGDSGSHFLGTALAVVTILGVAKIAVALSLLVPLVALAVPIGDTAAAIIRRKRAGRSIAEPDAGHLHHRMLARGMTPTETALAFYLMTGILGCIALAIFGHRTIIYVAVALMVVALLAIGLRTRRRAKPVLDKDGFVVVKGRRTTPAHYGRDTDPD